MPEFNAGDTDGQRVPLPFKDRAQYERFRADLGRAFESEGISDATVVQVGPGTSGWSGNAHRYVKYMSNGGTDQGWFEYGAWKPTSDTDFLFFSDYALVQAHRLNAPLNRKSRTFKNGEAPSDVNASGTPGFAHSPLGAKLTAVALKWNHEIYGTHNPAGGGFEFRFNLDVDMKLLSKPLTVYQRPRASGG